MNSEKYVYVTYIASTPEKVWAALLEGELTRQYWGHENVCDSDWRVGSKWKHIADDGKGSIKIEGEVLECLPQKRLVLTWISPERIADKTKHTRVTIDIEKVGEMVRLTVTHDQLYPEMLRGISSGWPRVLSSLKSFLETGQPLDVFA
jgi:uncharacterized protein YndB with AHSA1/START domain